MLVGAEEAVQVVPKGEFLLVLPVIGCPKVMVGGLPPACTE